MCPSLPRAWDLSLKPPCACRYGIQIGQAFGFDFGYGILRSTCSVTFGVV